MIKKNSHIKQKKTYKIQRAAAPSPKSIAVSNPQIAIQNRTKEKKNIACENKINAEIPQLEGNDRARTGFRFE